MYRMRTDYTEHVIQLRMQICEIMSLAAMPACAAIAIRRKLHGADRRREIIFP